MILRFRGHDAFMVGLGVFVEAAVPFRPLGANEVEIPDLDEFDDEQRGELAKLVRDPLPGSEAVTPVAVDDTSNAVVLVGEAPPRTGQGATREAWAVFAEANNIPVTADMSRDQIIKAVEAVQS